MIISNFSSRNSNILKSVPICMYITFSTCENLTFLSLSLWSNIILSSQHCLLLPVGVFPSGIFGLLSLSWDFFFYFLFDILMLLLFFHYCNSFLSFPPSFSMFSNANSTLSPLLSKLLFFFFSPFFLASSCRFLALLIL